MTLDRKRDRRPLHPNHQPEEPARLPVRWVVIVGLSAAVGIMVGTAKGLPAGVLASLVVAGVLNKMVH